MIIVNVTTFRLLLCFFSDLWVIQLIHIRIHIVLIIYLWLYFWFLLIIHSCSVLLSCFVPKCLIVWIILYIFASLLTSILFLLFLLTSIFISHLSLVLFFGALSTSGAPNLAHLPSMLSYDIFYLFFVCLHSYFEIQGICSNWSPYLDLVRLYLSFHDSHY